MSVSRGLVARRDEIARTLAGEAGKPIRDATTETERAAMTFHVAAEEARRLGGEVVPMDLAAHGEGRIAVTRRFPIGPVAAISPFNFPLNLSAHKVAPAIAAGNPIVLKPATRTPLSALLSRRTGEGGRASCRCAQRTADGACDRRPSGHRCPLQAAHVHGLVARRLGHESARREKENDPGARRQRRGHRRRERGHHTRGRRVAVGGFALAGQSCIAVQRVYVHAAVFDAFATELVRRVEALRVGDPMDPATDVGPMIEAAKQTASSNGWRKQSPRAGAC